MVAPMAERPLIMALANPAGDPAGGGEGGAQRRRHRTGALGLSQPGQHVPVLSLIFRGVASMSARRRSTTRMKIAFAWRALADLARPRAPTSCRRLGGQNLTFGPNY